VKNQYVGDVRDFGKYGLLKNLVGAGTGAPWKLGANWYLTPDDASRDGAHTAYLLLPQPNPYADADRELVDGLRHIVEHRGRDVRHVADGGILPDDTVYFDHLLRGAAAARHTWLQEALTATAGCDLVFLDPDNGLESTSRVAESPKPPRAAVSEVAQYLRRGQSVVVIQFFSRMAKHAEQVLHRLAQVAPACQDQDLAPFGMLWRVHPALLFLIVPASHEHATILRKRASDMVATPWGQFYNPPVDLIE
jgi:hypothetical protein